MNNHSKAKEALRKCIAIAWVAFVASLLQGNAFAQDITLNFSGTITTPTCVARVTAAGTQTLAGNAASISMPTLQAPAVRRAAQGDSLADRTTFEVDLATTLNANCSNAGKFQVAFISAAANVNTSLSGRAILGGSSSQVGVELSVNNSGTYNSISSIPTTMAGLIDSAGRSTQLGMNAPIQNGGKLTFGATPVKLAAANLDITDAIYSGTVTLGVNYF
jgi:hypothetical protein